MAVLRANKALSPCQNHSRNPYGGNGCIFAMIKTKKLIETRVHRDDISKSTPDSLHVFETVPPDTKATAAGIDRAANISGQAGNAAEAANKNVNNTPLHKSAVRAHNTRRSGKFVDNAGPLYPYNIPSYAVRKLGHSVLAFVLTSRRNRASRALIRRTWASGWGNIFFTMGKDHCPVPRRYLTNVFGCQSRAPIPQHETDALAREEDAILERVMREEPQDVVLYSEACLRSKASSSQRGSEIFDFEQCREPRRGGILGGVEDLV